MKNCICLIILYACFVVVGFPQNSTDLDSNPLRGIKEMHVVVENLKEYARNIGLNRDRIIVVTELRLQQQGIIITQEPTAPCLYVNINLTERAVNISVEVQEMVNLYRDPSIVCTATTWDRAIIGTGATSDRIIDKLKELLDIFLNDYLKANPKK